MSYPSTWKKIKFGDIAKRKSIRIDNPKESEYERYVGLEHLDSGEFVVKRWGSTKDVSSNMQIFNKNDILFARRNTYLKRISVALFDGVCSGDIIVIEPIINHIVEGFLPIYMQFEEFENKVVAWSAGAFSKRIKWKQLSDFEIWVPSKEEQQKIVDVIWSIHDNQERTEDLVQVTEKLKKGVLEELLIKGTGHKKFKKTELGEIPEEWDIFELGKICEERKDKDYPPYENKKYISLEQMNSNNLIQNDFISSESVESNTNKFFKGDLLYGKLRPYLDKASIANFDGICTTEILVLSSNFKTSNDYLLMHFKSKSFIDYNSHNSYGTKMPRTSFEILSKYKISLGEIEEQKKILTILNNLNLIINKCRTQIKFTANLKKKLTNEFLSGNLLIPKEVLN